MSKKVINNKICEAFGCNSKASKRIKLTVDEKKSITIYTCPDCIRKFNV